MNKNLSVSVVLPTYNEARLIPEAVDRCVKSLHGFDYEIVLVNDGSTDNSLEVMHGLSNKYPGRIIVVDNGVNLNVGISLRRGIAFSTKEWIVHDGIDLPLAPETIPALLQKLTDKTDVLVLERDSYPGYTLWRLVCSFGNRTLLRLLFRSPFTDMNFTQVYRSSIFEKFSILATSPSFTTPEIIFRSIRLGFNVHSVLWPYEKRPSGKPSFGKPHDILWTLYDFSRYFFCNKNKMLKSQSTASKQQHEAQKSVA